MSSSWWINMFSIIFILSISLWYLSMYDVWLCSNSPSVLHGRNSTTLWSEMFLRFLFNVEVVLSYYCFPFPFSHGAQTVLQGNHACLYNVIVVVIIIIISKFSLTFSWQFIFVFHHIIMSFLLVSIISCKLCKRHVFQCLWSSCVSINDILAINICVTIIEFM